jgi:heme exporter protein A
MSAISVKNLSRRYGRRWALVDVSFELDRGTVLMLAGHNGSGKTTLLRVLSTVLRPDHGTATVAGLDVVRQRAALRREIAMLSHMSYLYEALTARENLALVASFCGAPSGSVAQLLDKVGLADRAEDAVSTFSAGMRKRLSFARVLLQRPSVVFLDEPYGQLDPAGFELVDRVIADLKGNGATIIVATHQVEHVGTYADRTITLERGRLLAESLC